jgi:hypothetical protein
MIEFNKNLKEMDNCFKNKKDIKKDKYKKPFVVLIGLDPLKKIYKNLDKLYESGQIVYASLVQANSNLFEDSSSGDYPADVVFSNDDFYKSNPLELENISKELFRHKGKDNVPAELKEISDSITGEIERTFDVPIPLNITENREVYLTTIMVHRNHLPQRKLTSRILPIICETNELNVSVILPKRYWTEEFLEYYNMF